MASVAATPTRFDMGRVVSRTLGAVGRNFIVFYPLALVLDSGGIILLAQNPVFVAALLGEPPDATNPFAMFTPTYFAAVAVSTIASALLLGALTHGAVTHFNGRTAGIGDCMATGLRFFAPVLAIAILYYFGFLAGLLLLIVPGFMLMTAWAVVFPAAVVERAGVFGAFSRSRRLTKGHRWSIFFLLFAYGFVTYVAQIVGQQVGRVLLETGLLDRAWSAVVPMVLIAPMTSLLFTIGLASVYFELRHIKEGVQADQLAAVFD
jgi:hypothetical protein